MADKQYALDTNVFIEAARRYYAFDLAPGFWKGLVIHSDGGVVASIDRVKDELDKGKDELSEWAKNHFSHAFQTTNDVDVLETYRRVMAWAQSQAQFTDPAKAAFAASADGWLVAYAAAKGSIVVTHEVMNREIKRRVPIPNVCQAFGVRFIDTFEMLRELGVRFK